MLIQFTWLHCQSSLLFNGSMRKLHDAAIVLHEKLLYKGVHTVACLLPQDLRIFGRL